MSESAHGLPVYGMIIEAESGGRVVQIVWQLTFLQSDKDFSLFCKDGANYRPREGSGAKTARMADPSPFSSRLLSLGPVVSRASPFFTYRVQVVNFVIIPTIQQAFICFVHKIQTLHLLSRRLQRRPRIWRIKPRPLPTRDLLISAFAALRPPERKGRHVVDVV